jgi:hypothetical protein
VTIGLSGSHRAGKSTLARSFANKNGLEFVETSVGAVFKEMGLDPAITYDFKTRLTVQEAVIESCEKIYAKHSARGLCITDRTPLDFMAYTLADAVGDTVLPEDQERLDRYIDRCIEVTNRRFSALVVIQPGIPLIHEEGKAVLNKAYIEHLNAIILGLSVDERINVPHFYLPRHMTNLGERVAALDFVVGKITQRAVQELKFEPYIH